jgi:hypothetical protein
MATLLLACTMVGAILTQPRCLSCGNLPIVKCHPDLSAVILTLVALEETRISAALEMKIRRTLPDLVLPIHPININRATLCNRSERSVRSGLHSTYSLGNWRQFPNISNLFCSRCGSLDAQANLVEKQKRECPVRSPSDCPRRGCGAWFCGRHQFGPCLVGQFVPVRPLRER